MRVMSSLAVGVVFAAAATVAVAADYLISFKVDVANLSDEVSRVGVSCRVCKAAGLGTGQGSSGIGCFYTGPSSSPLIVGGAATQLVKQFRPGEPRSYVGQVSVAIEMNPGADRRLMNHYTCHLVVGRNDKEWVPVSMGAPLWATPDVSTAATVVKDAALP